jgi:Ca2+-binding EF-hand superfamily protein
MISFQFLFAIIVINLFVAVILEGFEESSRLEEANLSEFYLEDFKKKWGKFDKDATALISIRDLINFLAQIELPFKC